MSSRGRSAKKNIYTHYIFKWKLNLNLKAEGRQQKKLLKIQKKIKINTIFVAGEVKGG